jgi:hypothetical protein
LREEEQIAERLWIIAFQSGEDYIDIRDTYPR